MHEGDGRGAYTSMHGCVGVFPTSYLISFIVPPIPKWAQGGRYARGRCYERQDRQWHITYCAEIVNPSKKDTSKKAEDRSCRFLNAARRKFFAHAAKSQEKNDGDLSAIKPVAFKSIIAAKSNAATRQSISSPAASSRAFASNVSVNEQKLQDMGCQQEKFQVQALKMRLRQKIFSKDIDNLLKVHNCRHVTKLVHPIWSHITNTVQNL